MKYATRKALEGSIKKWEKIIDGTASDKGTDNCSLCQRFMLDCQTINEEKCPVYEVTGKKYCKNTPYSDWMVAVRKRDKKMNAYGAKATDDQTVMCAVLEVEFLKSLLPAKD
jgi:hypothetical protein